MDLRLLEDFLSLARTRSFSRSADERNITQPAFSRRIQALETWAGAILIDRSTYPTNLTAAGLIFSSAAEDVVRRLALARRAVSDVGSGESDTVGIAAVHALSRTFVPQWLRHIEAEVGLVKCRLLSDHTHDAVGALVEGASDFLLCFKHASVDLRLQSKGFASLVLGTDTVLPISAAGPDGEPVFSLPGRPEAPLRLLAYAPDSYLGRVLDTFIEARAEPLHLARVYENSFTEALKAMAVAGYGCAWLPRQSVEEELGSGKLVRAGPAEWDVEVEIRLYRAAEKSRPEVEKIWRVCSGRPPKDDRVMRADA